MLRCFINTFSLYELSALWLKKHTCMYLSDSRKIVLMKIPPWLDLHLCMRGNSLEEPRQPLHKQLAKLKFMSLVI